MPKDRDIMMLPTFEKKKFSQVTLRSILISIDCVKLYSYIKCTSFECFNFTLGLEVSLYYRQFQFVSRKCSIIAEIFNVHNYSTQRVTNRKQ